MVSFSKTFGGDCRPSKGPPCHFSASQRATTVAICDSHPVGEPLLAQLKEEFIALERYHGNWFTWCAQMYLVRHLYRFLFELDVIVYYPFLLKWIFKVVCIIWRTSILEVEWSEVNYTPGIIRLGIFNARMVSGCLDNYNALQVKDTSRQSGQSRGLHEYTLIIIQQFCYCYDDYLKRNPMFIQCNFLS